MEHRSALGVFLALTAQRPISALAGRSVAFSSSTGSTVQGSQAISQTTAGQGAVNLVDVDANLLHPALVEDIHKHIQVASSVGVRQFVVPGSTVEDSKGAIDLALRHPNVIFPTAGVHPYHVEGCGSLDEAMAEIADIARRDEVRCIGECGLDFSDSFPAAELQLPWFERQVQIACEVRKPLFLHERLAFGAFIEVLKRYDSTHGLPPCLVHCFTGTADELQEYLKLGFFVGVTGFICKEKHGRALREAVKMVPLDRLMVETDAPYLGFPGCRKGHDKPKQQNPNVPSALPAVVGMLANILNVPYAEVAARTAANSREFFGMKDPSSV